MMRNPFCKSPVETGTRKAEEYRLRERLFLDTGRSILIEQGFNELNLDRVAEATGWSKGTVHNHFKTKEDLVTAIAVDSTELRMQFFARAQKFQGRSRERACALGMAAQIFSTLHPHYFGSELVVKMAMLRERATKERREALDLCDQRCFQMVHEIIQEGADGGDLVLRPPTTVADLTFTCVALSLGADTVSLNFRELVSKMGLSNPFITLRESYPRLFDGYGWKPLSSDWDYAETHRRIAAEIFPEECAKILLS